MFMVRRFPFDTKSPIGYALAVVIEYIFDVYMLIIIKCIAIIGLATLPMLFLLVNDVIRELNTIVAMSRLHAGEKLSQFIQIHSDTVQLSFF